METNKALQNCEDIQRKTKHQEQKIHSKDLLKRDLEWKPRSCSRHRYLLSCIPSYDSRCKYDCQVHLLISSVGWQRLNTGTEVVCILWHHGCKPINSSKFCVLNIGCILNHSVWRSYINVLFHFSLVIFILTQMVCLSVSPSFPPPYVVLPDICKRQPCL